MSQTNKSVISTPHASSDDMYEKLFLRNQGYISDGLQQKIRSTKVLIAGCGVGSTFAEAAIRMGFESLTLADGDTVDTSNLNRQAYSYSDVGTKKVTALSKRLKAINPQATIKEHDDWITVDNAASLVSGCDLIFDTIDFLDLVAITAVHDEANRHKKPIISAVSAGWGAAACYFPPTDSDVCMFRKLFGLADYGSVKNDSYVEHFSQFIGRLADELDPAVVQAMAKALTVMEDGTPCPAPHVSAGSFGVASLAVTMAARILNGDKVATAPNLIVANMSVISAGEANKTIQL